MRDGIGNLAILFGPAGRKNPMTFEGAALFIDLVFETTPLRKLYVEVPEHNLAEMGSLLDNAFVEEARLPDHEFYKGGYVDMIYASMSRQFWQTTGRSKYPSSRSHQ